MKGAANFQLALEEMSDVFEARNPKKRSFELAAAARQRARAQREAEAGI
jgi:hypothetical protein